MPKTLKLTVVVNLILMFVVMGCTSDNKHVLVKKQLIDTDTIVIQDVAVFNSLNMTVESGKDVVIAQGKIFAISNTGSEYSKNEHIINGQGATLLPGLIDMHGHLMNATAPAWTIATPEPEHYLQAYVYSGVTSIFDPGDGFGEAFERREKVAKGELLGPQIFTVGNIITHPDGHPRSIIQELAPAWIRWYLVPKVADSVENEKDIDEIIDSRVNDKADGIKIVVDQIPLGAPILSQNLINSIVDKAKQKGLRTVAHIGTTNDAIMAADAGVSMWIHNVYKESIPEDMIDKLAAYNIPMVTTSEVFDNYGRLQGGPRKSTKLEQETVSQEMLDSFYPIPDDFDVGSLRSWVTLMEDTIDVRRGNVKRLHEAGLTIFAGSDVQSGVFPGASLHRELVKLVEAGLTPAEAIRAATYAPAVYLTQSQNPEFGIIAVGKQADLLLVEGDPTSDINTLANIRDVLLDGVLLDRIPLNEN